MNNVLNVNSVNFIYHTLTSEIEAIKDISFTLDKGEFGAIVGPSGCGKTTILSLIAGLLKPTKGEITLDGKPVDVSKIGYMFQKDHLFEWRTIWQNVILGLEIKKKQKDTNLTDNVKNLLEKYGLKDFIKSKPRELSGGMRQRVALIRTLATDPKLLLLDEPFSALDYQTRLNVCDDVYNIIKSENKTALLVTHDISEAISLADKVIILSKRPSYVKKVMKIDLTSYGTPLKRREAHEFRALFDEIWKEIQYDKEKES